MTDTDPTYDPPPSAEVATTPTTTYLTADEILAVEDLKAEEVEVPEWGGKVLVQPLTGTERDAYIASLSTLNPRTGKREPNNTNATAKLVARSIVGLDGARIFTDGQVNALGKKSGGALEKVSEVASRLSGLGGDAEKDAEGNSATTPSDGSTSSEPATPASP